MNSPAKAPAKPPLKSYERLTHVVRLSPRELKKAVGNVEGFNAKFALLITRSVGTMACAYLFAIIAFISLPAILIQANVLTKSDVPNFFTKPGLILIVAWIAQTFLQLVLLSIIMVGQSVQQSASDARATKEFTDTETILDRLDTHTAGGIRDVLDAIHALGQPHQTPPAGAS
ncbi:MAG: hypothetical protein M3Z95_04170 [Actinomycetota bacterium]|nr:hypothetical protein [Actinomycetota bacterium]